MANVTLRVFMYNASTGAPLTGFGGHVYAVSAGASVNSSNPLTESTDNPGEYSRTIANGSYDIYVDADKSGSAVSGDLKMSSVWAGIPDGTVEPSMTTFAEEF